MSNKQQAKNIEEFLGGLNGAEFWPSVEPLLMKDSLLKRANALVAYSSLAEKWPTSAHSAPYGVECISDLHSALLLSILGAYKSSMVMLRSSIENTIRQYLMTNGLSSYSSFQISEMFVDAFHLSKSHKRPSQKTIISLRKSYKYLCSYVHSSTESVMTLDARLKQIPKFDTDRAKAAFQEISTVSQNTIDCLLMFSAKEVRASHADIRDLILDSASREIKAEY